MVLAYAEGDVLHIRRTDGQPIGPVRLFDARGQLVLQDAGTASGMHIDLAGHAAAMYALHAGPVRMCVVMP